MRRQDFVMIKMPLKAFITDESFPFFIQYGGHTGSLFVHSHEDFSELVIVTDGSAEHIVGDERYRISKGDVFVISNELEHGYDNPRNFKICNIMFSPNFWHGFDFDITKTAGFQALFVLEPQYTKQSRFCSRLKLNESDFTKICAIIELIHSEYNTKKDGWKTVCTAEFLRLIVLLCRLYSFEPDGKDGEVINLAKAVAYIQNNISEKVSVANLAKISNYSERQFNRVFKDAYGCRPVEYITNMKIGCACELLKSNHISITDAAIKCGYSDSNYFTRVFRKIKGVTPTEYRKSFFAD